VPALPEQSTNVHASVPLDTTTRLDNTIELPLCISSKQEMRGLTEKLWNGQLCFLDGAISSLHIPVISDAKVLTRTAQTLFHFLVHRDEGLTFVSADRH
jgi:hypothetical protein